MNGVILYEYVGTIRKPLDESNLGDFIRFARQRVYISSGAYDLETISNIYVTGLELLMRIEPANIRDKDCYKRNLKTLVQDSYSIITPFRQS